MSGSQFYDEAAEAILKIVKQSGEPLETKEIEERIKTVMKVSRSKLIYRLQNMRAEGQLRGKFMGPGKGVWVWWAGIITNTVQHEMQTTGGKKK